MSDVLVAYKLLIKRFLDGVIPAEEFQATYLECFKNEKHLDELLFQLLDELFGDVDSFTTDQKLLAEQPEFYLDEAELREKARIAASRLSALER